MRKPRIRKKTPGRAANVTVIVIMVIYMVISLDTISLAGIGTEGLAPLLGGIILFVMFFKTAYDSMDPAYGSGSSIGGLGLVFIRGCGAILLGAILMFVMNFIKPEFFHGSVLSRSNQPYKP